MKPEEKARGKNNPNEIQSYHIEKFLKEKGVYGKK